ncbi:nucleotidyltransferase family protein [Paenibacillus sp. P32E]|uniref:nucleotidyltransferase family protein n=1 Tax=Paenibacillus sp. P32E TaxID=1349434 RepID=UPI00093A4CF4|nr:nucleotidyltransferase family protein [Paenibacillus sp. P32E]OKP89116.1 hypothetical protein A3848_16570 [Paenibacillus sp. P32E]
MNELSHEELFLLHLAKYHFELTSFDCEEFIEQMDWDRLFTVCVRHKLFTLLYKAMERYIPDEKKEPFAKRFSYKAMFKNRLLSELKQIIEITQQREIKYTYLKGFVISNLLYDDLNARDSNDIDIVVDENDFLAFSELLRDVKFERTLYSDSLYAVETLVKNSSNQGIFHEYWYLKQVGEIKIAVELKSNTSAIPRKHIKEFCEKNEVYIVEGVKIVSNDMLHTFLHLCANAYSDSEERVGVERGFRLRDYVDIYSYLNKYQTRMDWNLIAELSNKYEMLHKIFCVLNNLNSLFDCIPTNIIEIFNTVNNTYNYQGYETGSVVAWKTSFSHRMFNYNDRILEYRGLCLERWFSPMNVNFNKPVKILNRKDSVLPRNFRKCFGYRDHNLQYAYRYEYDAENLYLIIQSTWPEKYHLSFYFYTNSLDLCGPSANFNIREILFKVFNDKIEIELDTKPIKRIQLEEVQRSQTEVEVTIPLEEVLSADTSCKYGYYSVLWEDYGERLLPVNMGGYGNEDDPEEVDNLGILAFT